MDIDAHMDKLYKIIDFRPNLKIFNAVAPKEGELAALKKANYNGAIILFDPLSGNITDPKEVVKLRPFMEFCNGYIPADSTVDKALLDRVCDGYLITFKRLTDEEKEVVYGEE